MDSLDSASASPGQGAKSVPRRHSQQKLIRCPEYESPLFAIVDGGIEVKCRSCRGGLHHFSRAFLERIWQALKQGLDPFAEEPSA